MHNVKSHMNTLSLIFIMLLCTVFTVKPVHAEMKKTLGNWDVHYIAFTSTFLTPEVARANQLLRSGKSAVVNISVLDKRNQQAQEVEISGSARNLLGTSKELIFKQVNEGEAIYYLASVPFSNKEVLRFSVDIKQGKSTQNLKFQQTMYVED